MIPFFLSAPGITGGSDLHALFENRFNPGTGRPSYVDAAQPVRNGDVANLSAALLGLPAVPGSLMVPEFAKPLTFVRAGTTNTLSWPAFLTSYTLEFADDLDAGTWTPLTDGVIEMGGQQVYTFTSPPPDARFFRLRKR